MNHDQSLIYQQLLQLGDFFELDVRFDELLFLHELRDLDESWRPYNTSKPHNPRQGLSLFSLDGNDDGVLDLNSVLEYNKANKTNYNEMSFRTATKNWFQLSSINTRLEDLKAHLGRSHLIKLAEGGFFPPHRDRGEGFRLIAFFNCAPSELFFLIEDEKLFFESGKLYFLNALKEHSVFSFKENSIMLVLNVELSHDSFRFVRHHLRYR